jgi:hypothetical protein
MTKKEIIEAVENGGALMQEFCIQKIYNYIVYNGVDKRITEKQYVSAKEHFKGRLKCDSLFGAITRHFYKLKN